MTSEELLSRLSDNLQTTNQEARTILDAVVQNMSDQLAQGHRFTIPLFGTFDTVTREKRRSFDSETGQYMLMPPERVIAFEENINKDNNRKDGES